MGQFEFRSKNEGNNFDFGHFGIYGLPMFTPPKQHPMPKALQVLASLPKLMKKDIKNNPVTDCTKCYNDILLAIEDCSIDDTASTHEILECVETVLVTSSDCLVCVCDVLGILGGADSSVCDPAKIVEHYRAKKLL